MEKKNNYTFINPRRFFLSLISRLSGSTDTIFINNIKDIELYNTLLKNSSQKGYGIEHHLATPSWNPIYNIESVDNQTWKNTRKYFHMISSKINLQNLEQITIEYSKKFYNNNKIITSKVISKLICTIYWKILFDTEIDNQTLEILYQGSIEWKKQLSVKGKGNTDIKNECVQLVKNIIIQTEKYKQLSELMNTSKETQKEILSSFIQPFFISPMINYGDIFVSVEKYKNYFTKPKETESFILECIRLQHPFPILERLITYSFSYNGKLYPKNTQLYVEFDTFIQDTTFDLKKWNVNNIDNVYKTIPFGVGSRSCLGKKFALTSLISMVDILIYHPNFNPKMDHKFSGRNNDNMTSFYEIIYFIKTLCVTITKVLSR